MGQRRAVAVQRGVPGPSNDDLHPDPDERRLAIAMEAGDARAAVSLLMDLHGTYIYRYCRQMVGTDADGEDVSQTVFMQAFEAIQRRSRVGKVRPWLRGIARHRCLDRLEGRRKSPMPVPIEELDRAVDADAAQDGPIPDPRLGKALDDCLDELDPRSRTVVLLRFHDQLSYDDISRLTGDRSGALRVRVNRALPALRDCMKRKGGIP